MLFHIRHETKLSYTAPVAETVFEVRMAPVSSEDQTALNYHLRIEPHAPVSSYRDGHGNRVDLFNIAAPYQELSIVASSYIRTHRRGPARLDGLMCDPGAFNNIDALPYRQFSALADRSEALEGFLAGLPRPPWPLRQGLEGLVRAVRERLTYEKGVTTVRTTAGEALGLGRGVCQDFAHVLIAACRGLGIPARYVCGYVHHPGEIETHAWVQAWGGPEAGWIDLEPTAAEGPAFVGDDHVVVAVGRDYLDVPPNRGVWKGLAEESMSVRVTVEPVERLPQEWDDLLTLQRPTSAPRAARRPRSRQVLRPTNGALGGPGLPDQAPPEADLHRQQGEQQQQEGGTSSNAGGRPVSRIDAV